MVPGWIFSTFPEVEFELTLTETNNLYTHTHTYTHMQKSWCIYEYEEIKQPSKDKLSIL